MPAFGAGGVEGDGEDQARRGEAGVVGLAVGVVEVWVAWAADVERAGGGAGAALAGVGVGAAGGWMAGAGGRALVEDAVEGCGAVKGVRPEM